MAPSNPPRTLSLRRPLLCWFATKLFTWSSFLLLSFHRDPSASGLKNRFLALGKMLAIWDSAHYDAIIRNGYDEAWRMVFFPLYPLTVRLTASWLGNVEWSGILLSNLCLVVGVVLLYNLLREPYGEWTATAALLLFLTAPTSLFFITMYTESMFFLLSVMVFILLDRQRWFAAATLILLASLTRNVGILLSVPFAVSYWRRLRSAPSPLSDGILKFIALLAWMGLGLVAYMSYAWSLHGDPFAFIQKQTRFGNHTTYCFHTFLRNLIPLPGYFCREVFPLGDRMGFQFFVLALPACVYGARNFRRIKVADLVYLLFMVLFFSALLNPSSSARYLSALYPLWLMYALMLDRLEHRRWALAVGLLMLSAWQLYMNWRWSMEMFVN